MANPITHCPFVDAVEKMVPKKGSGGGVYDHEPNLPEGMPGRSGGELPEKTRDPIAPDVPGFTEVGKSFRLKV
jgi:hypothetical protein